MALLNINPSSIVSTVATTAAGRAAQAVAQRMSPKFVRDVQRVLSVTGAVGGLLGVNTGIDALDGILGLRGDATNRPTPMLGGLSLAQAKAIYEQSKALRAARKNLFFLRITDENPPIGNYNPASPNASPLSLSRIGAAAGELVQGIVGPVGSIASSISNSLGISLGGMAGTSIASVAVDCFDMLAVDVSYGTELVADHVQIGSSFIDRPTGRNPTDLTITTMDDEAGTLKRWVNGKINQVARPDGTFGLPAEYLCGVEIVHAIPSDQVAGYEAAYSKALRLRVQSINVDLSRRDQALAEYTIVFSQFDHFMGT